MATQERVGVLGGGQLGRMMAQAASRLGVSLTVLDPGGLGSPAGMVSGQAITGSFTDAAKVRELAERCKASGEVMFLNDYQNAFNTGCRDLMLKL